jgi:hypothetical protein
LASGESRAGAKDLRVGSATPKEPSSGNYAKLLISNTVKQKYGTLK